MSDKTDQEWTEALRNDAQKGGIKNDVHILEAKLIRSYFLNVNQKNDFTTNNNGLLKIYEAANQQRLFNRKRASFVTQLLDSLDELISTKRAFAVAASLACVLTAGNVVQFMMSQNEAPEVYRSTGAITVSRSVPSPIEATEALRNALLSKNIRFSINYYSAQRIEIQIRASQEARLIFNQYEIELPEDGIVNIVFSQR